MTEAQPLTWGFVQVGLDEQIMAQLHIPAIVPA